MSYYSSDAATIAATLHQLADRIAAVGDVAPAVIAASIDLQVHCSSGTVPERVAAVDRLTAALGLTATGWTSSTGHRILSVVDRRAHGLGPVDAQVYTSLAAEADGRSGERAPGAGAS